MLSKLTITLTDAESAALSATVAATNAQRLERDPDAELATEETYLDNDIHHLVLGGYVATAKADQHAKLSQGLDLLTPDQLSTVLKAVPPEVLAQIGVSA